MDEVFTCPAKGLGFVPIGFMCDACVLCPELDTNGILLKVEPTHKLCWY